MSVSAGNCPNPQCGSGNIHHRPKLGDWTCLDCGQCWRAEAASREAPESKRNLFLSYGRRDARELADRLCVDLAAEGYEVWRDTGEIDPGTSWQHEIADGLRSAQLVVAVMTPHSVRTTGSADNPDNVDSVCLGEIAYALFHPPPRPVVPVMARTCEPPLAIFHLDYVDMRAWTDSPEQYQAGLRRLLAGIEAALRGERRYRSWYHQLNPFDFAAFLHPKRQDFCGREWLFDRIDAWRIASGPEDKTVRVWDAQSGAELDAQSGAELEVIPGTCDVRAIAAGPLKSPYRALGRAQETVIQESGDGQTLAWFPASLHYIVTHPSGRTWAGFENIHLHIITPEGCPTPSPPD
jgi:hypothetical protein